MVIHLWKQIKQRLEELGCLDEVMLNPPTNSSSCGGLARALGVRLPIELIELLQVHNGQNTREGLALFYGGFFLSLDGIYSSWKSWRDIDENEMNMDCADYMESDPEGYIKPLYSNRFWIPISDDGGGNHIGIDYSPGPKGKIGQIITFGSDEDTKHLLAPDLRSFILKYISDLKSAKWNGEYLEF